MGTTVFAANVCGKVKAHKDKNRCFNNACGQFNHKIKLPEMVININIIICTCCLKTLPA